MWRAELDGGNFGGAFFDNANLNSASAKGASFVGAHMVGVLLVGATLTDANFQGANLGRARMFQANGKDINFSGANLVGAEAINSFFTSSNADAGGPKTNFDGAWVKGFRHDGALEENLLAKAHRHELPAEGFFPATPEPTDEKILVNGIPGSDKVVYDAAMAELDELIGLHSVNQKVRSLINHLQVSEVRVQLGEPELDYTLHAVYTGSPGTGKTTVARIVARLFYAIGAMDKDILVEADKSALVADYAGQTAGKTNRLVDSALGGTLIIDEAYSLTQSEGDAYGQEAIATLTKRLEDDRKRFSCIATGYEKEMRSFVNANSGLKSRFSHFIDFPDYSTGEMVEIMKLMLDKKHFRYSPDLLAGVSVLLAAAKIKEGERFGNGRTVRHTFEKMTWNMSNRLVEEGILQRRNREDLLMPKVADLPFEEIVGMPAELFADLASMSWMDPGSGAVVPIKDIGVESSFPCLTRESFERIEKIVLGWRETVDNAPATAYV
jgi:shikimate kinase